MLKETSRSPETEAAKLGANVGVYVDAPLDTSQWAVAQAFQRGLLPFDIPALAGLELAHRSCPLTGCLAGSDWYDIVPLPGDRVAIVVGDAMSHGTAAASLTVQLRAAAHVLMDLDLPPDAVLGRLNRMMLKMNPPAFATCLCATLDPATGSGGVARAGSPAPVLARPENGGVIEVPAGLPLGLGEAKYEASHFALPADAILALFTDGLVGRGSRACDEGVAGLRQALTGSVQQPLQAACDAIIDDPGQRDRQDDATLVLLRAR
jgi:serine phosphatase RsbU (regulator of sigma subunit)